MILSLWITLIVLSSFLLWYGYHAQADLIRIIAFTLFFLLGASVAPFLGDAAPFGGVFYINGSTEEYVYGNNLTGYHWEYEYSSAPSFNNPNDPASVFLFHKDINYDYTQFTSATLAFWFMVLSTLGWAIIWFERKED